MTVGSRTWRSSRWCCGSGESNNGTRFQVIWLGGVTVFLVTALAWKGMAEGKWRAEERVSEALAFIWEQGT